MFFDPSNFSVGGAAEFLSGRCSPADASRNKLKLVTEAHNHEMANKIPPVMPIQPTDSGFTSPNIRP